MQTYSLPRKRQHHRVVLTDHTHRVQRRVQHHRMNPEAGYRHTGIVGNGDLGEGLGLPLPHAAQSPKCRAIAITPPGELVICLSNIHRCCSHRRPHRQISRRRHRTFAQHALRMQHPHRIGLPSMGIHRHHPSTRLLGRAHHHLQPHPADGGQNQRSQQGQLIHHPAPDLIAGPQHQLDKARPGKQHRVADGMIGQPFLSAQRQPAGQHHPAHIGSLHHRTQQWMVATNQTRGAHPGTRTGPNRAQPEAAMHKTIGRQLDPAGTRTGKHRLPIHAHTRAEQLPGSGQQRIDFGLALGQRNHRARRLGCQRLLYSCVQAGTGADFEIYPSPQ